MSVPTVKLSSGYDIPTIGLGTWKTPNTREGIEAIKIGIKTGYRLIDTATLYQNEGEIGIAIEELTNEGIIKREDLFIVTKIWVTDNNPKLIRNAIYRSLKQLKTTYIDLYLIHWPCFVDLGYNRDKDDMNFIYLPDGDENKKGYDKDNILGVWKVMEKLVEEGLIRSIGVSNFSIPKLLHIEDNSKIKPVINQVECHPYFSQGAMLNFCKNHNMYLMAYYPLSGNKDIENMPKLLDNTKLIELSQNNNKSVAQICIKWGLKRGEILIPKSIHENRIKENFDIFDFELNDIEMNIIDSLNINMRLCLGKQFYSEESNVKLLLWDENE